LPIYDSPWGSTDQQFRVLPNYFGHLLNDVQADKASAPPIPLRRVSSARYTTEPCNDDPKSLEAPVNVTSRARGAADAGRDADGPTVTENDYLALQP